MPYYHSKCDGEIRWLPPFLVVPRCKECGHAWSRLAVFALRKPTDMYFLAKPLILPKGKTSYAKWADKAPPGVASVASHLPNWPRWLRITAFLSTLLLGSLVFYGLWLVGIWAVIVGAAIALLIPLIVTLRKMK